MYGHPVYFAETFIDPGRFRGTCYRAANWQLLGLTTGRGKNDQTNKPNRPIKEILGLPLTSTFPQVPHPAMTMRRGRREPGRTGSDHRSQHTRAAERIGRPEAQNRTACHGRETAAETEHGENQGRSAAGCGARGQAGYRRIGSGWSRAPWCRCVYRRQPGCHRARHAPRRRPLPGMPPGKSVPPEGAGDAGKVRGARTAGSDRVRDGATALQRLRAGLHRRRTEDGGRRQVRCDGRGDDRPVEVRHRSAIQAVGNAAGTTGDAACRQPRSGI